MMMWLSFCDPDKPKGEQFLGGCIVEVDDQPDHLDRARIVLARAIKKAWALGINPGGEVMSMEVGPDREEFARAYLNRLMSKAEIAEMDKRAVH